MNLLIVTTDSHYEMYENFFLKTVPKNITTLHKVLTSVGDGRYQSSSWQEGVTTKLKWALECFEQFLRWTRNSDHSVVKLSCGVGCGGLIGDDG